MSSGRRSGFFAGGNGSLLQAALAPIVQEFTLVTAAGGGATDTGDTRSHLRQDRREKVQPRNGAGGTVLIDAVVEIPPVRQALNPG